MRAMLKSKTHRACVTETNINYEAHNFIPTLVYIDTNNSITETKRAVEATSF